jgi:hypothetical protein
MKNIQNFKFNELLAGKADSRLVSKYKKWLESEKPDYFGGDRDLELRRIHSSRNLISIVQVKKGLELLIF